MSSPSLLSFVDAPVVVGDPDGRVAYVNPAFEERFSVSAGEAKGQPLAALFEGGLREAVLRAVAHVCEQGASARFRSRYAGVGYASVVSPIVAEDARVGFVILFLETTAEDERFHALQREICAPIADVERVLDELLEQTGGRRNEQYRALTEEALLALERIRKRSQEITGPTTPRGSDESEAS